VTVHIRVHKARLASEISRMSEAFGYATVAVIARIGPTGMIVFLPHIPSGPNRLLIERFTKLRMSGWPISVGAD